MDVSPKGDPPGFVQVLDASTLAIPDSPAIAGQIPTATCCKTRA